MTQGIYIRTKKARENISKALMGKHPSEETRKKMSVVHKGHPCTNETKDKISKANKGKPSWIKGGHLSEIHKHNISNASMGKCFSEEHKHKLSLTHKGRSLSKIHKQNISKSLSGQKCHFWKGGVSFLPYSINWTRSLKRDIRERDNYTCQLCGKLQEDRAFDIHHIDENKQNCNPNNLITLCHSCHSQVNADKDQKSWIKYFTGKTDRSGGGKIRLKN